MLKTGIEPSAASSSTTRVGAGAHADRLRRGARAPAPCRSTDSPRASCSSPRAQHHRVAAELDDAGLERQPRAGRRLLEHAARRRGPPAPATSAARPSARRRGRAARAARRDELLAGEEMPRQDGQSSRDAGPDLEPLPRPRACPPRRARPAAPSSRATLAGWEWDVALLQEVPPWWPPALARACGAQARTALTSRNALLPLRRARRRAPARPIKSNGGGANAILVRGAARSPSTAAAAALVARAPRRARRAAARTASWVGNLHAQVHSAERAQADIARAPRRRCALGGGRAVRARRRLQRPRRRARAGLEHARRPRRRPRPRPRAGSPAGRARARPRRAVRPRAGDRRAAGTIRAGRASGPMPSRHARRRSRLAARPASAPAAAAATTAATAPSARAHDDPSPQPALQAGDVERRHEGLRSSSPTSRRSRSARRSPGPTTTARAQRQSPTTARFKSETLSEGDDVRATRADEGRHDRLRLHAPLRP